MVFGMPGVIACIINDLKEEPEDILRGLLISIESVSTMSCSSFISSSHTTTGVSCRQHWAATTLKFPLSFADKQSPRFQFFYVLFSILLNFFPLMLLFVVEV